MCIVYYYYFGLSELALLLHECRKFSVCLSFGSKIQVFGTTGCLYISLEEVFIKWDVEIWYTKEIMCSRVINFDYFNCPWNRGLASIVNR